MQASPCSPRDNARPPPHSLEHGGGSSNSSIRSRRRRCASCCGDAPRTRSGRGSGRRAPRSPPKSSCSVSRTNVIRSPFAHNRSSRRTCRRHSLEARCPLFVERAAPHVACTGLAELSALGHHDTVRDGFDLLDRLSLIRPYPTPQLAQREPVGLPAMNSMICSGSSPRSRGARRSPYRARARSCSCRVCGPR